MKILYLTHSAVGDRSFGSAMRSDFIRDALAKAAAVDTLVITGGPRLVLDEAWDERRIRTGNIATYGFSRGALRENAATKRWVKQVVDEGGYDLIVARYLDLALLVPRAARKRLVFDPDDFRKIAPAGLPQSLAARAKLFVRNQMARWLSKRVRHVWYSSPAKDQRPPTSRSSFLPNVIAPPDPARVRPARVAGRVLIVGLLTFAPNRDGLAWFAEHVWPALAARHPAAELQAVGKFDPADAVLFPQVHFQGFVEDLAAEYDKAALVIVPIRSGSGTQIKVIDAMIHARPLVVSRFSHGGFADDFRHQEHLLVADSAAEWVECCARLLENPGEAKEMGKRGEAQAAALYGVERLDRIVLDTLRSLGADG